MVQPDAAAPPARPERLYFLDNLRLAAIVLVIVLHAAITYMANPPTWWYVIDPQHDQFFSALVLLIDAPVMLVLFFIAGFFAYPSLERHGVKAFLHDKFLRIGLPWVCGVIFLAPPVTYLIDVTRGVEVTYLQFWTHDFWGPLYQQSVYWYLGILLLLFLLLAVAYSANARWQHLTRRPAAPPAILFAGFWAATGLWFFLANQVYPPDTWSSFGRLFFFQPERVFLYLSYFALGLYADRRGWFRPGGYGPDPVRAAVPAVVAGTLYVTGRLGFWGPPSGLRFQIANAVLFSVFCLAALLASAGICQRYGNGGGRPWAAAARHAYGIYYVHPLILYPLAYVFLAVPASIFVKAAVLILVTAALSWACSALVLARAPGTREVFGASSTRSGEA